MKITIRTIPHGTQDYETAGNWKNTDDGVDIEVSDMQNPDYEFVVGIHELIEWWLCRKRGITEKEVTEYDLAHLEADEPGDLPDAPYKNEHCIATAVERLLIGSAGMSWEDYNNTVSSL